MSRSTDPSTAKVIARFQTLAAASALAVVLVILAGGIVRSTGAGMGCPEWPKCFGQWVPPTSLGELPTDYRTRFNVHGHGVDEFNVYKTWTEYLNRLLGALTGLILLGTTIYGTVKGVYRTYRTGFFAVVVATFLIAVQGWLGAKVVSANLAPYMVTLHMLLALVILFLLLVGTRFATRQEEVSNSLPLAHLHRLSLALLVLVFVQVGLGTQVREAVDSILEVDSPPARGTVVPSIGVLFYVHRSFSLIVLLILLATYRVFRKENALKTSLGRLHMLSWAILALTIPAGMVLAYLGLPNWAQPIHLTGGSLLAAVLFLQWLRVYRLTYPHESAVLSSNFAAS
jgi:heme a synthase